MNDGMTIEYLMSRTDLNFKVHFRVNSAIGAIVTKWDMILTGKWILFINNAVIFLHPNNMPLVLCLLCYKTVRQYKFLVILDFILPNQCCYESMSTIVLLYVNISMYCFIKRINCVLIIDLAVQCTYTMCTLTAGREDLSWIS